MSWKDNSKRVDEVVGGDIWNPWQFRRFLPAQFEKSCLVDLEFRGLIAHPWTWVNRSKQVIEQLKSDSQTVEIAKEREAFYPDDFTFSKEDRRLYGLIYSLFFETAEDEKFDNAIKMIEHSKYRRWGNSKVSDFYARIANKIVTTAEIDGSGIVEAVAEHVCAKPERENFRDYNEYLFVNRLWKLGFCAKKYKGDWAVFSENFAKAVKAKECYVKEGIYYYKKSKGEDVTVSSVLAMSWDEIIEYRKSVADSVMTELKKSTGKESTKSMGCFVSNFPDL